MKNYPSILPILAKIKTKNSIEGWKNESIKMQKEIEVHANYTVFPEALFQSKAPNESPQEREYRRQSYQAETFPVWNAALSQLNRIFNPDNSKIEFRAKDGNDQVASDFIINELFDGMLPLNYFKEVILPNKIKDPNGLIILMMKSQNKMELKIIPSKNILEVVWGSYVLFKEEAHQYCIYTPEVVYEITETDAVAQKYSVKEVPQINNVDWGVYQLGGIYLKEDASGLKLFKSHFYDAVPSLNQMLYDCSTLSVCKAAHAFPQRVEYFDPCDASGCNNGYILDPNYSYHYGAEGETPNQVPNYIACPQCSGTGTKSKHSPLGVYQLKAPTRLNEGDAQLPFPGVAYVSPNPEILQFLRSEINLNADKAFRFMGVELSNNSVDYGQSALAKLIDRETLFSFLMDVSNQLFNLMDSVINLAGKIKFKDQWTPPFIQKPSHFAIRSKEAIAKDLGSLPLDKLPSQQRKSILLEAFPIQSKGFEQDIPQLDALYFDDDQNIQFKLNNHLISAWQIKFHQMPEYYLQKIIKSGIEWDKLDLVERFGVLEGVVGN